ncbi:magnesium transporter CorA family protein [Aquihabitans sp. McL0605]|uniref:magnesium transporter CorA family protein n=1 Tax=Aquihabitans sp. McL0605 TaxID=3415671 RepID=UPI003CEC2FB5
MGELADGLPGAVARSRIYRDGALVAEDVPEDELAGHLADDSSIVWVDLCDPNAAWLTAAAAELGLHELAIEDAIEAHQRPKLDHYPDHLFLASYTTVADADTADLQVNEIDAFVGSRWIITVHGEAFDMAAVVKRWDRSPDLARFGVGYLLYGLLDVVIDSYFDSVEVFDAYYDDLSETIFGDHPINPDQQLQWFQMRRALFQLHRLAVPMRESVSALMRREHGAIDDDLYPYFQDVYDHILRVTESTDALRDLVATIVETNLSLRDYRQNQVMKKVTSWAAIIAVPTLITGFYGMNVPYPGFAHRNGLWVSLALMVVLPIWLYSVFKRKDWL